MSSWSWSWLGCAIKREGRRCIALRCVALRYHTTTSASQHTIQFTQQFALFAVSAHPCPVVQPLAVILCFLRIPARFHSFTIYWILFISRFFFAILFLFLLFFTFNFAILKLNHGIHTKTRLWKCIREMTTFFASFPIDHLNRISVGIFS